MSDETEIAAALRQTAEATRTAAQVNAAGVAQRQQDSEKIEKQNIATGRVNRRIQALSIAQKNAGQTKIPAALIEDAEKFLAWIEA